MDWIASIQFLFTVSLTYSVSSFFVASFLSSTMIETRLSVLRTNGYCSSRTFELRIEEYFRIEITVDDAAID